MRRLSQKEYIAVAIAVIVTGLFFSIIYSSFSITNAAGTLKNAIAGTKQILQEKVQARTVPKVVVAVQPVVTVHDYIKGTGATATYGDTIYIQYVAKLPNGKVFANSTTNSQPIKVTLKRGALLKGLEIGMLNMKENGNREIVIPPELAYGNVPIANPKGTIIIPADSTVTYDVVLLKVTKGNTAS